MVQVDRLRRRQGPRRHSLQRRANVLRERHRLRPREVQPRLRRADLHLGRRPPRHGRPAQERGAGAGPRPRRGQRAAHRLGALRAQRRGSVDVKAVGRVRDAGRARSRGRRRRGALVLRVARSKRRASTSTSSWRASSRARTPSTTSSTRTRGSARSCARPPSQGCPRARPSTAALADDDVALGWPRICCACRTSSATRPRRARRRRSRPSRPSSRRSSTPSTAIDASSMRTIRKRPAIASRSSTRRASRSRPRSACWGSPRPTRCSSAGGRGSARKRFGSDATTTRTVCGRRG